MSVFVSGRGLVPQHLVQRLKTKVDDSGHGEKAKALEDPVKEVVQNAKDLVEQIDVDAKTKKADVLRNSRAIVNKLAADHMKAPTSTSKQKGVLPEVIGDGLFALGTSGRTHPVGEKYKSRPRAMKTSTIRDELMEAAKEAEKDSE